MGVNIIDREYTNIFRPLDPDTNWLIGNVGVWQKLRIRGDFSSRVEFDSMSQLFIDSPNILTLSDGSSWYDKGFGEGFPIALQWNFVDLTQNPIVTTYNRVPTTGYLFIARIENDKAFLVDITGSPISLTWMPSNMLPVESANFKIKDVSAWSLAQPQGIKFSYGHMENGQFQNGNLASFIDGSLTEFLAENTDSMNFGDTIPMEFLGNQSGMSVAFCNLTYISQLGANYVYEIEICFMISSFFDDITNFENDISPPQTFDANSLTDNFHIIGMPIYNNPNIKIQTDMSATAKLGNTGWFDENFNGLPNEFSIDSLTYTNVLTGVIVPQLDYSKAIKVTCNIDGVLNISGQTACAYGFAWIPLEGTDYRQNEYPFYKNLKMQTGGEADTFNDVFYVTNAIDPTVRLGYSSDDARMDVKNVRFRQDPVVSNRINFEAEFMPNTDFFAFMDAKDSTERNYILWVSVADQTDVVNKSNRVSLLLDFRPMDIFIEPVGPYDNMTIEFLNHVQDEDGISPLCGTDYRIEDDILGRVFFPVDTAVGPTIPIPLSISYGIIVERDSDGLTYSLDNFKIDVTQYPSPSQYNFADSRGFKLGAGNNKNFIKLEHYPPNDTGSLVGIRGLYGYKFRWEDWLQRFNVPQLVVDDFYDNSEPQNGINNDWYHWLSTNGWTMHFVVYTDAILNGSVVRYENKKEITFHDYDSNADITTELRYYRESDNTLLAGGVDPITGDPLGVILSNEQVRLEIEYTRTTGVWTSLANVYGLNTIEVFEGAGQMEYRQLSSIWLPEVDNPLIPLAGDTLLGVQIIAPNVLRCTCIIEPNLLIPATKYKITGREGCK